MPISLEERRQQYLQKPLTTEPTQESKSTSLADRRSAYLKQSTPVEKPEAGTSLQTAGEFLVDAVSDIGAVVGGMGGAAIGGGFGAIPGAVAGAGLGTMAEQGLRLLLGMTPQEQLVSAAQDPVLNDLANTIGFDLLGGLAAKGVTKGVKAVGEKVGRGAAKALSQVDEPAKEAARRLADQGIDLKSVPAFEGGDRLLGPETMSRLASPTKTKAARAEIIKNNQEVIEQITGAKTKDLTAEKSFQRGQQVITETSKASEKLSRDTVSREALEQLDVLKSRGAELEQLVKKPTGMAPVQDAAYKKAIQEDVESNAKEILEVSKRISPGFEDLDKALTVDTLKAITSGKRTPLARNVIKSVVAHPERVDAALAVNRKLKPIMRDEVLTQLMGKADKVDFLQNNKQVFEKLLPTKFLKGGATSYSNLLDFYKATAQSSAEKLVPSPASAIIGTRGAQTLMWFGRNAARGGVLSAANALFGDITGGVLVTLGSNSFARRVLLNPKYSQIAIKAAKQQPLTTPELKTLMSAIAGSRIVINQLDKQGKKVGKGKEVVLEERTNFVPRQVQR